MIKTVGEIQLINKVRNLAKKVRTQIPLKYLEECNLQAIADTFGISLKWGELPKDKAGVYIKLNREIILNTQVRSKERQNFTFFHELIHDQIEHDDNLLSLMGDAFINYDVTLERLCDAGAAELLVPADEIIEIMREKGFSVRTIPELCNKYQASSIAAALQMVLYANHHCYLVIAEKNLVNTPDLPMFDLSSTRKGHLRLKITYSARSPSAKYWIKQGQILSNTHPIHSILHSETGEIIKCKAEIPFASGKGWKVDCEITKFKNSVFAFFNISTPSFNSKQLPLF